MFFIAMAVIAVLIGADQLIKLAVVNNLKLGAERFDSYILGQMPVYIRLCRVNQLAVFGNYQLLINYV